MKRNFLFLITFMAIFSLLSAQNADKKWAIGLHGGKNEYNGDLGNGILNFGKAYYGFGALTLDRYLSPSFDLGLNCSYGTYGFYKNAYERMLGKKTDASFMLAYKLNNGKILPVDSKLSPSLNIGVGSAFYKGARMNESGSDIIIPLGLGLKYNFNNWLAAKYMFMYHFTDGDIRDKVKNGSNDQFVKHTLGIVISLGFQGDSDKDGVKDNMDKCPGTPAGVKVDQFGCPLDKDKDGVADYIDQCPEVAGLEKFAGCPDSDNDGIQDSKDKCPTVFGLEKFDGCPDTDNDGIQDSEDKCPKIFGLSKFNGCPDTDNDGVPDSEDRCPTVAGKESLRGCPDRDNDGIPDIDDKCPDVAGIKSNKGCPEVKEETKKIFKQALTGIQFETGKDVIRKPSYTILDQVVKVMVENPSYNLEINGYTDNVGDDNQNLILSQKRADAVKKYLVGKGVDESRMTAKGYGEANPIADNSTTNGRSLNRRVEFKVIF